MEKKEYKDLREIRLGNIIGSLLIVSVLGGIAVYLLHGRPKPSPQPEKPLWFFEKYDTGRFYFFGGENLMDYRTVCESADCTPLLEHLDTLGLLNDVRREGLHLTVKQGGAEYHFKVEAMGMKLDETIETGKRAE